jgi:hypothetical protein
MQAVRTHKKRPEFGDPRHEGKAFPRFIPIPQPQPAETTYPLSAVLGQRQVSTIEDEGQIVFHAVGDTGGNYGTEVQEAIAQAMEDQYSSKKMRSSDPAFLYHLGDVIYFNGQSEAYPAQFYEPYQYYPGIIFAIPGNHDGDTHVRRGDLPDAEPSLDGFTQNFCVPQRSQRNNAYRDTMTQPYVYWTLQAPFVTIIGLYSNVDGTLDGPGAAMQQQWLTQQLQQADKSTAIMVAVHHPPYSLDTMHGGYPYIGDAIDQAAKKAHIWPDLILSGHVHNYQRFSRKVMVDSDSQKTIPYLIAGAGGHANRPERLHKIQKSTSGSVPLPFKTNETGVTLENGNDTEPGFLRVTATNKGDLTVEYYTVPFGTTDAKRFDTVQVHVTRP